MGNKLSTEKADKSHMLKSVNNYWDMLPSELKEKIMKLKESQEAIDRWRTNCFIFILSFIFVLFFIFIFVFVVEGLTWGELRIV